MQDIVFPDRFIFGASTAAFQIEGSPRHDGKGLSVWDDFSHRKGKIRNGDTADTACDHYHRYQEDVGLIGDLNLDAYRFSISWPRIYPKGSGPVNMKGVDFYSRLVDALLEKQIEPYVTLFHWDLPLFLQQQHKGFESRETIDRFAEYTETVVKHLGDRVKHWITINEPFEYAGLGHFLGCHAPGRKSLWAYFRVMHNLLLAHGRAVQVIRALRPTSKAGITVSINPIHPASKSEKDQWAASLASQFLNDITLSPLLRGEYPKLLWKRMRLFRPKIESSDMALIREPTDFLGINVYSRNLATHKWYIPFFSSWVESEDVPEAEFVKNGKSYTSMGWEVYPDSILDALRMVQNDYGNPPVIITENGASFMDEVVDAKVDDSKRIAFLDAYLRKVRQAMSEGADVRGYFCWSLLDNFEWAEGLSKRFGLIHVDYETQKRTIKQSGYWYRDLIASKAS